MIKHKYEFECLLQTSNPDLVFQTETWDNEISEPDWVIALLAGYAFSSVDRKGQKGGGIVIIYRSSFRLTQIISEPTHKACHTLDCIFTNMDGSQSHFLHTLLRGELHVSVKEAALCQFRPWHKINKEDLVETLAKSPPLLVPDTNKAADNFDGWIRSAMDQLAPEKINSREIKPQPPGITQILNL